MTTAPAAVSLAAAVAVEVDGLPVWRPCPRVPAPIGREPVDGWPRLAAVLRAHGAVLARLLDASSYPAFRVEARAPGGALVGMVEWFRSTETRCFRPSEEWVVGPLRSAPADGAELAAAQPAVLVAA